MLRVRPHDLERIIHVHGRVTVLHWGPRVEEVGGKGKGKLLRKCLCAKEPGQAELSLS